MKRKGWILFLALLWKGMVVTAGHGSVPAGGPVRPGAINAKDTIYFDLPHAAVTSSYIDIPVYFFSDDTVDAVDFSFNFNEGKLTYDTLVQPKSYLSCLAYFNTTDRKVRFTSNSLQQVQDSVAIVSLRFFINLGPCDKINPGDFYNIKAYLNGNLCSYKFTPAVPYGLLPNFTNSSPCSGNTITFSDASAIQGAPGAVNGWSWNFGDGNTSSLENPAHTYTATGTYSVTLIVFSSQGCTDTIVKPVTVAAKPTVNFTSSVKSGCQPVAINFSDSSVTSPGSSYFWNFGDGGASSAVNPAHTYTAGGVYTVKHYVSISGGCADSLVRTAYITVYSAPRAKFSAASGCTGSVINFSDSSSVLSGTITGWNWNFGDGNTSAQQSPSHTYTAAGTYSVSLQVTSDHACTDQFIKIITVNARPVVNFGAGALSGCASLAVNFADSSVTGSGSSFLWNFGDGGTSSAVNPAHTYTAGGVYTVKHYVTSAGGCSDSLVRAAYITVYNLPRAGFSATSGCTGSPVTFKDSSGIASGTITGWNWNFGDGNAGTQQNPVHTYTASGTYTAHLLVTSNQGCADSIIKSVIVNAKPAVSFGAGILSGCASLAVNFTDSSATGAGSSFLWNFGDGGTSSAVNPAHTYTAGGVYTVKHYVTAAGGCSDSLVRAAYITVHESPKANFSAISGCTGSPVTFKDSSGIASGTITGWNWNFGDGSAGTQQNPVHTYTGSGTYTVLLSVTSNQGCADSIIKSVTVNAKPAVYFSASALSGCVPLSVNFLDSSATAAGSAFLWSFGDNGVSSSMNTSHTYTAAGVYTVKHLVTAAGGCSDSLVKTAYITIHGLPLDSFSFSPDTGFLPDAGITFANLSSGATAWLWNFGDGDSSKSISPLHVFTKAGSYTVCMTAYSAFGCSSVHCSELTVMEGNAPVGVPGGFTPNGDNHNDVLLVRGGPLLKMEFRVFNEWGNEVFFSSAQDEGWDGKFNGLPQPEGTYVYTLKGKTIHKQDIDLSGTVSLMR